VPEIPVRLRPGINADFTPSLNEGGWSAGNLIRWRDGMPEKLGGWAKFYPFTISSIVRALHAWEALDTTRYLAVGAEASLSVISAGYNKVITPQTLTTNNAPNFTTTSGSNQVRVNDAVGAVTMDDTVIIQTPISVGGLILSGAYPIAQSTGANSYIILAASNATASVTSGGVVPIFDTTAGQPFVQVTFPNHGYSVGDTANFPIATSVGGLTIRGLYTVTTVSNANVFSITAPNQANATATVTMNGGNARLLYQLAVGPPPLGVGWGIGGYGLGGYGTGVVPPPAVGMPITATDWTLDNWGEDLVACPSGGPIYIWSPSNGISTARMIGQGPIANGGIFVAMPEQQIIAWASDVEGVQDPLLVRWCDIGDYTVWTAASTNQAGSYRIPTGSRIVGGIQASQQGVLWTDIDVWSMQYIGYPLVYGFNKLGSGCGLVGKHAMGMLNNVVYWMGLDQFYALEGGEVIPIPCPVWDVIFQDLDTTQLEKVRAAPSSGFNEIAWFYPSKSGGTGEVDSYVKFNVLQAAWDYGKLSRTAWIDQSILGEPIGADPSGYIYQHEIAEDADGHPMSSWVQSGNWMVSEGTNFAFVDRFIPDFKFGKFGSTQDAQNTVTISGVAYPADPPWVKGPYPANENTRFITTHMRARELAVRIDFDPHNWSRLGNVRYRGAPAGRR
jgi:hypothetical protein